MGDWNSHKADIRAWKKNAKADDELILTDRPILSVKLEGGRIIVYYKNEEDHIEGGSFVEYVDGPEDRRQWLIRCISTHWVSSPGIQIMLSKATIDRLLREMQS